MNPTESLDDLEADNWDALYRCRHDSDHRHSVLALLKELLRNPDLKVLHRAMNAAGRIRGAFDATDALADLIPLVIKHVSSDDELIRRVAIGSLHCIGSHDIKCAVPALIGACDDENLLDAALLALVDISNGSTAAVQCFHRFSSHSNGKIRRITIRGLGISNATDNASIAVITAATNDRNKYVREMAGKVLAKINARP
ncbi:HEAT repeat domain-containing protein [Novipirellula sp. SH528]|uniref:HEAT repeat domain-containing protein n=1 Tax=Novipirellula sp. SH528 TaxID=3454466 RepID=UPI003FA0F51D